MIHNLYLIDLLNLLILYSNFILFVNYYNVIASNATSIIYNVHLIDFVNRPNLSYGLIIYTLSSFVTSIAITFLSLSRTQIMNLASLFYLKANQSTSIDDQESTSTFLSIAHIHPMQLHAVFLYFEVIFDIVFLYH
jgi:hypothetical protein